MAMVGVGRRWGEGRMSRAVSAWPECASFPHLNPPPQSLGRRPDGGGGSGGWGGEGPAVVGGPSARGMDSRVGARE